MVACEGIDGSGKPANIRMEVSAMDEDGLLWRNRWCLEMPFSGSTTLRGETNRDHLFWNIQYRDLSQRKGGHVVSDGSSASRWMDSAKEGVDG